MFYRVILMYITKDGCASGTTVGDLIDYLAKQPKDALVFVDYYGNLSLLNQVIGHKNNHRNDAWNEANEITGPSKYIRLKP